MNISLDNDFALRSSTSSIGRLSAFLILLGVLSSMSGGSIYAQVYQVYVAAESDDVVQRVSFDASERVAWIDTTISVGRYPTETDGPHGMTVAPDGQSWFVSIAHGNPYGYLAKYDTKTNSLQGTVDLGLFPASMEISKHTGMLYVVNFDLHGEMEPSSVMVVDPETMDLISEFETGIMPHGTRLNTKGTKGYHVSMMSDELIEIDTYGFEVSRILSLRNTHEAEHNMNETPDHTHSDHHATEHNPPTIKEQLEALESTGGRMAWMNEMNQSKPKEDTDHSQMAHHTPVIKPTWVDPHPNDRYVYVAGNGSDEIIEVDVEKWTLKRRIPTGKAPYNLEVSPDGRYLISALKGAGATSIIDLEQGIEIAQIPNSRKISHGVAISPDSKFAFISVEGIGGEAGSVDIISIENKARVSVVETGKQAGGIAFFRMTE